MCTFAFDVETAPLPDDIVRRRVKPFEDKPYEWRSDWKDETNKRKEQDWIDSRDQREEDHIAKAIAKAGLKAQMSRILCVIYATAGEEPKIDWADNPEHEIGVLERFWERCRAAFGPAKRGMLAPDGAAIGFNIDGFDIPMLWQRSLANGLNPNRLVGQAVFTQCRYAHYRFVDLYRHWAGSQWSPSQTPSISLNALADVLGLRGKVTEGGISGKNFYKVAATDRPRAERYARQEGLVTWQIAERLGVVMMNRAPSNATYAVNDAGVVV